ncbi:Hsp20/alpha crystallin family protein [Siminovitchia acidinfaciens]|uniref:Hsp20/alpha crystallin family protein n=1 Tax=Siminovitchia acidinfaciens TaxID=2321395 RepID=A0A429XY19_9BACI|nr:Hsp20/alpha crystallin family protein [Siminovitchia acidinfaciens]RST73630.1 Hsp20/alpha crystallin family protein [Siminovitchia acidinfaciens]VEF48007.1 heat shock protein Hsp20 [Bacillus freudenreichii]
MTEKFSKDDSSKKSPEPINHLMKAMNDFFEHRPVKGFFESLDELFVSSPFSASFPVELKETDSKYVIKAKLPGIKKEQIEIDVLQQFVTISVMHRETITTENEKQEMIQHKDSMRRTSRTVPLTKAIDTKNVKASYENGLLTIAINKLKGKRIDIT